jgi:quercetin dioxygenase-like cupin family protein/quinol monooxygenase YgiN
MQIRQSGSQPSRKGPTDWFTGTVRMDRLFSPPDPARVTGVLVTFEPGARTAWHTHPLGQTLIVTSGCGWVQRDGGAIEEIRPGDVIWFAPGEKHWHGATPATAMSHIAIQEQLNGSYADWMEHVTDAQYRQGAAAQTQKPAVGNDQVYWVLTLAVDQMEKFKALIQKFVAATEKETGAVQYEYNISDDQRTVDIYERYADSKAAMFHVEKTFGSLSKEFLALAKPTRWVIYGTPSNELKQAIADFHPIYMTPFDGFIR